MIIIIALEIKPVFLFSPKIYTLSKKSKKKKKEHWAPHTHLLKVCKHKIWNFIETRRDTYRLSFDLCIKSIYDARTTHNNFSSQNGEREKKATTE